MIDVILWDIDGTLLDFRAAEREAIRRCFALFGLGLCTDDMAERYSAVNLRWWERLERGEVDKKRLLTGRFEEFFAAEGIDCGRVADFNAEYQVRLGDTICYNDESDRLIARLRGRVRQYAVTNGTAVAQKRKLERSGLGALFDGVFISDEVGAEKPDGAFFSYVLSRVGPWEPSRTMIVGDSLTSDMRGGRGAGLVCCWYNPKGLPVPAEPRPDWVIRDLRQVESLI